VATAVAVEAVIAFAAVDAVFLGVSADPVIAFPAVDSVVVVSAGDAVVALRANEDVVSVSAIESDRKRARQGALRAEIDVVVAFAAEDGNAIEVRRVEVVNDVVGNDLDEFVIALEGDEVISSRADDGEDSVDDIDRGCSAGGGRRIVLEAEEQVPAVGV